MKKFVVDASVAVKWFVPEIQSAAAERLLDPEIVLSAPDLILSELGNTPTLLARAQAAMRGATSSRLTDGKPSSRNTRLKAATERVPGLAISTPIGRPPRA